MSTDKKTKASEEENKFLIDSICLAIEKMMERIITEKSPRSRAKSWCRPHDQSRERLTFDSVLYNSMTGRQRLPARPRDIRLNLAQKEFTIGWGELSEVLAKLVRLRIIDGNRDSFPLSRGRPPSTLSPERRGRYSYYDFSDLENRIARVLKKQENIEMITERLTSNEKLFIFLKYSFSAAFYQAKENEKAFLNSFRPYGITPQQLEVNKKKAGPWIPFRDMSNEKLETLAAAYAKLSLQDLKKNNIISIYKIAMILRTIIAQDESTTADRSQPS